VYVTKSLQDANEYAMGRRPDYEFVTERKKSRKSLAKSILKCTDSRCSVTRVIHKNHYDQHWVVHEAGEHLIDGKLHSPQPKRRYTWTDAQSKCLKHALQSTSTCTPRDLFAALSDKGLLQGASIRNIRYWLQRDRRKHPVTAQGDSNLETIQLCLTALVAASVSPKSPHKAIILPVAGGHLFTGYDALDKRPGKTRFGNVSFCLPVT